LKHAQPAQRWRYHPFRRVATLHAQSGRRAKASPERLAGGVAFRQPPDCGSCLAVSARAATSGTMRMPTGHVLSSRPPSLTDAGPSSAPFRTGGRKNKFPARMRRSLLLLSLAGCLGIIAPLPMAGANERVGITCELVNPPPETEPKRAPDVLCEYLITVADDFVVDVYHNGKPVPEAKRELLVERFGATAEKVKVTVRTGDWLVFHVVQNRLRWEGSKYFAVAGCFAKDEFGFVSDPASENWSVCDDPAKAPGFIRNRNAGRKVRALAIEVPWGEGDQYMKECAGQDFGGRALWGRAPSTWIKFVAGEAGMVELNDRRAERIEGKKRMERTPEPALAEPRLFLPKRWPVP